MKIRPVGAGLLHADRQTDRHDAAKSRFLQFCEKRLETTKLFIAQSKKRKMKNKNCEALLDAVIVTSVETRNLFVTQFATPSFYVLPPTTKYLL